MMKAKWKYKSINGDLPYMIIEQGPLMTDIYMQAKHLIHAKGILIVGADSPSLLTEYERNVLEHMLSNSEISFQEINKFIWVDNYDRAFNETDFGDSGDTCFFLARKPDDFILNKMPRLKGYFKKKMSEDLIDIFRDYGLDTIYLAYDPPELQVVSGNTKLLNFIDKLIVVED